jgi:cytochrome P450
MPEHASMTVHAIRTRLKSHARVAWARCRGHRLPPGRLLNLDQAEKADRQFLLRCFEQHGPIFKALAWNELWVCILGIPRCTRFLKEHNESLQPVTLDIRRVVPRGFLRQMRGDTHRHYRRALLQGVRSQQPEAVRPILEAIADHELTALARARQDTPQALEAALTRITTSMLITLVFGAQPETPAARSLLAGYERLGPHGLIWNIGPRQQEAFRELQATLRALDPTATTGGILGRIAQTQALDETLLGNLIYMVEMGRYDTSGLFRWLTRYACEHPSQLDHLRENANAPAAHEHARAFVLETLRMDQSERLIRRAERDITFEGFHLPRGSTIRLCLWEAHKDANAFPDPFRFDPGRFLANPPAGDAFSPFGLDHHHCPFSELSVVMGEAYLRALSRLAVVEKIADGDPIRGPYHWEPSVHFCARLRLHHHLP